MTSSEFNNFLQKFTPSLNSFAFKLTKSAEDADDLYQETAYRAIKNQKKFRPGTNLKAWLFTIMKNIFINNYRKKIRANTIIDTTANDYYINSGSAIVANQAESNILVTEIRSMINGLDNTLKEPFMMHFSGYKYQEIADHLVVPLGTVKSRIFFARIALKKLINKRYDKEDGLQKRA